MQYLTKWSYSFRSRSCCHKSRVHPNITINEVYSLHSYITKRNKMCFVDLAHHVEKWIWTMNTIVHFTSTSCTPCTCMDITNRLQIPEQSETVYMCAHGQLPHTCLFSMHVGVVHTHSTYICMHVQPFHYPQATHMA